uniref:Uncharacterized protein n=1 Tax=Corethron hystrix TaxID=216773 RepID=A0A6U5EE97_9STRA
MMAAALGLKFADSTRRILMYTKGADRHKEFYAVMRGIFPVQELCGTLTALQMSRRYVLGIDLPLWRVLSPSVALHALANFRGMKPMFKWGSGAPWSEMQLAPWSMADDSTLSQMMKKTFKKLLWLVFISRVVVSCIKNYYMVNRQAVKRFTIYKENKAAFAADVAAEQILKDGN